MKTLTFDRKLLLILTLPIFLIFLSLHSCEEIDEDSDPFKADDYEVNESRSESSDINLATNINATIFPEGDVDWYRFQTDNSGEWDRVQLEVKNVSEDLEIRMTVYDGDGVELFGINAGSVGADLTTTMDTEGGTYYVKIVSRWDGKIGAYKLNVKNLDFNDEYAPNDTRSDAYNLETLPVSNVEGILVSDEEVDWFKFTTENDGIWDYVQFDITDVADDLEVRMTVYNVDGNEIFAVNSGTKGANLRHTLATQGGTYYVKISSRWSDVGDGYYTLDIANLHANDDFEPNDTRNTSYDLGSLPVSNIQGTVIWTDGDEDWYMFESQNDNPFIVKITDVGDELQVNLRVEDGPGNSHTINSGSSGADVQLSTDDMTYITPEGGGIYYVRVQGRYGSHRGDYTLSIEQ